MWTTSKTYPVDERVRHVLRGSGSQCRILIETNHLLLSVGSFFTRLLMSLWLETEWCLHAWGTGIMALFCVLMEIQLLPNYESVTRCSPTSVSRLTIYVSFKSIYVYSKENTVNLYLLLSHFQILASKLRYQLKIHRSSSLRYSIWHHEKC